MRRRIHPKRALARFLVDVGFGFGIFWRRDPMVRHRLNQWRQRWRP